MDTEALALRAWTIADLPEESSHRHELIDGGLIVNPHPTWEHQTAVWEVASALARALAPEHQVVPGANVIQGDQTLVIPDVVVAHRGDYGLGPSPKDVLLVVEVLSPSTRRHDLTLKRALYTEWGVALWIVDPVEKTILRDGSTYAEVDVPGYVSG